MKIFDAIRRIVVFGLGVWTIANALVNPEERVGQLVIGMIMVGILPVESLTFWRGGSGSSTVSQGPAPEPGSPQRPSGVND